MTSKKSSSSSSMQGQQQSLSAVETKSYLPALPLDLLYTILSHLQYRVRDLSFCCLVSRLFQKIATPFLYERLFLRDQRRLRLVFSTLSQNPFLCSLVKVLELRVFPFGLDAESLEHLESQIETTFTNAVNLQELVWTRTGSLNDRLLPRLLCSSKVLGRLEITGDARTWSTKALIKYIQPGIKHLGIILPERSVVNALVEVADKLAQTQNPRDHDYDVAVGGIKSLSLLCQHSPFLTDAHLMAMAPSLQNLQRLSLAGCRAVTGQGIVAVLKSACSNGRAGIEELMIEGLNIQSKDLAVLQPHVSSLRLFSVTYPRSASSSGSNVLPLAVVHDFYQNFGSLVEHAERLEELTHYAGAVCRAVEDVQDSDLDSNESGDEMEPDLFDTRAEGEIRLGHDLSDELTFPRKHIHRSLRPTPPPNLPLLPSSFLKRLVASKGTKLQKLRLHGIGISLEQLSLVVENCPLLKELVVQIWEDDLQRLAELLVLLPHLETLHILASASSDTVLTERDIQLLAQGCVDANHQRRIRFERFISHGAQDGIPREFVEGSGLRQIGFRNRVWQIERSVIPTIQDDRPPQGSTPESFTDSTSWRLNVSLKRWDPATDMFPEVLLVVKA